MAFRITRKKNINVLRIGVKIIGTIIGLYASGIMLQVMGEVMVNTSSPFYHGLKLIGWTVTTPTYNSSGYYDCASGSLSYIAGTTSQNSCITATSGTGILSVVGLLAVVWIVMEFVDIGF